MTLALPENLLSSEVGKELEQRGFLLNFRSSYLVARNWIQIALLGDPPRAGLETLLPVLRSLGVGNGVHATTSGHVGTHRPGS